MPGAGVYREGMADKGTPSFSSYGIAIGLPIGAALGLVFDNFALFVGIGLIAGVLFDAYGYGTKKKADPRPPDRTE